MDRRTLLLGALVLAGCAQARPAGVVTAATPAPSAGVASPTASGPVIGTDQTASGAMLAALLTGARPASTATLGSDWRARLGDGATSAAPVFAGTAWAQLSDSDEPPDDVVGDLAGLVEPDVSIMAAGTLDGALAWMAPATASVTSLDQVARRLAGKAVAVPSLAVERADGLPGLSVIYGVKLSHLVEDDPIARAALITSGRAAFGAFRRTEYLDTDQFRELADPIGMVTPDPVVLAVNAAFADADPKSVLALNAVLQALSDADLVDLQRQVAGGSAAADVARQWLVGKGLVT